MKKVTTTALLDMMKRARRDLTTIRDEVETRPDHVRLAKDVLANHAMDLRATIAEIIRYIES